MLLDAPSPTQPEKGGEYVGSNSKGQKDGPFGGSALTPRLKKDNNARSVRAREMSDKKQGEKKTKNKKEEQEEKDRSKTHVK